MFHFELRMIKTVEQCLPLPPCSPRTISFVRPLAGLAQPALPCVTTYTAAPPPKHPVILNSRERSDMGAQLISELVTFVLALEERRCWCPAAAAAAPSAPVKVMQQRRGGRAPQWGACFSLLLMLLLAPIGSDISMRFLHLCEPGSD